MEDIARCSSLRAPLVALRHRMSLSFPFEDISRASQATTISKRESSHETIEHTLNRPYLIDSCHQPEEKGHPIEKGSRKRTEKPRFQREGHHSVDEEQVKRSHRDHVFANVACHQQGQNGIAVKYYYDHRHRRPTINDTHRHALTDRYGSGQSIETPHRTTDGRHAHQRLEPNAVADSDPVEINRSSGRNEEVLDRQGLLDSKNGSQTTGFNLRNTLESISNERNLQYVRRELDLEN